MEDIFKSTWSFKKGDLSGFESFLHDVIGFFIIEGVVVNTTTQNFRPSIKAETLWDNAITRVDESIIKNLQDCINQSLFSGIKNCIILFMHTMEGYRYNESRLSDLLASLFDRYAKLLKGVCDKRIALVIENDEYAPFIVESRHELEKLNSSFDLANFELLKNSEYVLIL
jgi:hypothetical protein